MGSNNLATSIELVRSAPGVARVVFRSENGVQILSRAVCDELRTMVKALKRETSVRVVVFEAQGRTFLAGADLMELGALTRKSARRFARDGQRLFQRIAELPAVTLAAIHAPCVGGGCELALACDLRMAATSARIGLPEVTLGIVPGWGGSVRSTLLLGPAVARRIILSGELLSGDEAARLALVDAAFPDDQFRAAVDARIAQLLKAGPAAQLRARRLIDEISPAKFARLLGREAAAFAACYAGDEPAEGVKAFLEKRLAGW
jgi:enoyl-CoA hydratase/carnithine racemase